MRILVLGLDGATWDQLNPMMDQGVLPNIKEICDHYVSGRAETIVPPVTAPAWLSIATGLNPGKTGVFDYINRIDVRSEKVVPVSSRYYEDKAVWDFLNGHGIKTGVFNYPTLHPAPKVDGFVVGGIGSDKYKNLCYPEGLLGEVENLCKDYEVLLNLRNPKYRKNMDLFFEDIHRVLEGQAVVLKYLIQEKEWDFFFAVFSVTDWIQHVLWKDIDDTHPLHDTKRSGRAREKYLKVWKRTDEIIGEILGMLPGDTVFLIISDHGSGPLTSVFYPNSWLEKKGWLVRKRGQALKQYIAQQVKSISESFDNKYGNAVAYRVQKKLLKIDSSIDFIDLDNSLAYSPEHNTMYGCVNITEKGRALNGFKNQLVDALRALPEEFKGIKSAEVMLPEDVYKGPYIELSPDIFFTINGYQATIEIPFDDRIFVETPSIDLRTGSHRTHGIFLARGDIFNNMTLDISILDLAPTILSLYGVQIPEKMDGRPLTECIKPDVAKSMHIKIGDAQERASSLAEGDGDLDKMKDVLKSLGYL